MFKNILLNACYNIATALIKLRIPSYILLSQSTFSKFLAERNKGNDGQLPKNCRYYSRRKGKPMFKIRGRLLKIDCGIEIEIDRKSSILGKA